MISKSGLLETLSAQADSLRLANIFRAISVGGDLKSVFEDVVGDQLGTIPSPIHDMLADKKRVRHVSHQLCRLALRTAVTQAFELAKYYCESTNQKELWGKQSWRVVIRLIRNAFNHNFHFKFSTNDLSLLPLSWANITLTEDLQGVEITDEHFSTGDAIAWLTELERFVSELK